MTNLMGRWFERMPFLIQFLWHPALALDLVDDNDEPDHSKIVPLLVIVSVLALHACGHPLGVIQFVATLAASYGYGMFKSFLDAKQYGATATLAENVSSVLNRTENRTETITKTVIERDPELGVQPTSK